ncbi:MAG: hypothetical protein J6W64_03120 [Bacilli bacterium]|nr:hypothetical protein [Bacilli bacterium]
MRRIFSLALIVVIFTLASLSGCKSKKSTIYNDTDKEGHSYINLKDEDFIVDNFEIGEIPYVFIEKLSRISNYEKENIGQTNTKKIIDYTQSIHDVYTSTDKEKHLITRSTSTLVKLYHEAYYKDDIVSYRDKEKDEFVDVSTEEYKSIYGFLPYDKLLEGFILNDETIISVEKVEDYKYKVSIDGEKAGAYVKIQMKKHGSLSDYPTFYKVEITISMKDDFSPIDISLHSEYQITKPLFGQADCIQDYVVTYKISE